MEIGDRIKLFRNKLDISQKELADRIGKLDSRERSKWGQSRIANYEKNQRMPDLDDIKLINLYTEFFCVIPFIPTYS